MSASITGQVVRLPRHQTAQDSACRLEIERLSGQRPQLVEALLVDISRNGAQFLLSEELEDNEIVFLRMYVAALDLEFRLPAKILWQRPESDQLLAVGCVFEREMDWETLGELFLCGVLSTDLPASESPLP